jgi:NADPH-dependent 2,4-dienoyl-CoA reductase/sulfur reductase-like enzyme
MNRRDCLRALGLSGLTAGLGWTAAPSARAQGVGESSGFQSSGIDARRIQDTRTAATIVDGKVIQPQRELPILHQTDVLVVGGGSAGVVAAIAARRAGANVTLVERYGHFGGSGPAGSSC